MSYRWWGSHLLNLAFNKVGRHREGEREREGEGARGRGLTWWGSHLLNFTLNKIKSEKRERKSGCVQSYVRNLESERREMEREIRMHARIVLYLHTALIEQSGSKDSRRD